MQFEHTGTQGSVFFRTASPHLFRSQHASGSTICCKGKLVNDILHENISSIQRKAERTIGAACMASHVLARNAKHPATSVCEQRAHETSSVCTA